MEPVGICVNCDECFTLLVSEEKKFQYETYKKEIPFLKEDEVKVLIHWVAYQHLSDNKIHIRYKVSIDSNKANDNNIEEENIFVEKYVEREYPADSAYYNDLVEKTKAKFECVGGKYICCTGEKWKEFCDYIINERDKFLNDIKTLTNDNSLTLKDISCFANCNNIILSFNKEIPSNQCQWLTTNKGLNEKYNYRKVIKYPDSSSCQCDKKDNDSRYCLDWLNDAIEEL